MLRVEIRPARIEDCPALARVIIDATISAFGGRVPDACLNWLTVEESAANWARNFEPGGLDPGEYIFVAEVERTDIIGLAMVGLQSADHLQDEHITARFPRDLYSIQVDPAWQRRGIGRRLVAKVAEALLKDGVTSLLVRVLVDNPNRIFYERLGAVLVGSQPYDWEGYSTQELLYGWDDICQFCGTAEPVSTDSH
jgi:GNAT superfamily N-acetyltransferase